LQDWVLLFSFCPCLTVNHALPGKASFNAKSLFPFGECRNSQGTLPTDKLFTGQRLDTTGLYYYGARYYDPQIGRFISPDPTIPDPKNPQALNRYSYCINNPFKYIDPSGLDFVDSDGNTIQEIEDIYNAMMNNPNIPDYIKTRIQTLHDSNRHVTIKYIDGGASVGISKFDSSLYSMGDEIQIGRDCLSDSTVFGSVFAHECSHVYEGNPGASIEEEAQGYLIEYEVGKALGRNMSGSYAEQVFNASGARLDYDGYLAYSSKDYLQNVSGILTSGKNRTSDVYSSMPYRQNDMKSSMLVKQGMLADGSSKFWAGAYSIFSGVVVIGYSWR
jgi:RHS repeat-associated protein